MKKKNYYLYVTHFICRFMYTFTSCGRPDYVASDYMHDSGDGANYLRDINRVINDVSFDDILSSIGIHTTNSDGYDLDIASKKVLKKIYERAVIKYE